MPISDALCHTMILYAVSADERRTIELYEKCKHAEDQISLLLGTIEKYEAWITLSGSVPTPYDFQADFDIGTNRALDAILELIDQKWSQDRNLGPGYVGEQIWRRLLARFRDQIFIPVLTKQSGLMLDQKQSGKVYFPSKQGLLVILRALFFFHATVLRPAVCNITDRREKRLSRSPLDGGRPRDATLWPLLRLAAESGMRTAELAEIMVDERLDKRAEGTRAQRIRRETKRLSEALRAMRRREQADSVPENI